MSSNTQINNTPDLAYRMKSHRVELCRLRRQIKNAIIDKFPKYLYSYSTLLWILATVFILDFKSEILSLLVPNFIDLVAVNLFFSSHIISFVVTLIFVTIGLTKLLYILRGTLKIEIWVVCSAICSILYGIDVFENLACSTPVGELLVILCLFSVIFVTIEAKKFFYLFRVTKNNKSFGFVISPQKHYFDGREVCVDTVCELIRKTLTENVCDSFAIGICGRWGSGKTTVLKSLRVRMNKEFKIIEFSPWQSSTSSSLIADFFLNLANTLSPHDKKLRKKILEYASLLIEFCPIPEVGGIAELFQKKSYNQESISNLRAEIEEVLETYNFKIIVLIDDIDRLNGQELFEVLKLIRNTADFKNIAYVVTYDRQYIVEALNDKIVSRADQYIEKIFTAEISLPAYENYLVLQVLYIELHKHFGSDKRLWPKIHQSILRNKKGNVYSLNQHIKSYRNAIRFANLLIVDINLLIKNLSSLDDINFLELFDLEVIKYFYPADYELLQYSPESVLNLDVDNFNRLYFAPYQSIDEDKFEIRTLKSYSAKMIVYDLFFRSDHSDVNNVSIIYESNFYNYFALRILKTEISQSEFYEPIFDSNIDIDIVVNEWFERRPRVVDSVILHLKSYSLQNNALEPNLRFIHLLFAWATQCVNIKNIDIFKTLSTTFPMKQLEYVQETIVEQLEEVANCEGNFLYRAYIIMSFAPYPEDPTYPLDYEQSYLISIKQATDLATKIIRAAFQNENIARIDSFSDKKSDLMRLLHAFNKTIQLYENPEEFNYINYAINFVISYFKENIESGKIRRGENISDLVKSFSFEIDDDYYDQECIDDEKASNRDKIDTYFGSLDNLKLIINDFYEASDKDKQSAINKIQSCI